MTIRTIRLNRGGKNFVFRYQPGQERDILHEISCAAEDNNVHLDALDMMTICFQLAIGSAQDVAEPAM